MIDTLNIKYDLIASCKAGVTIHPKRYMEAIGFKIWIYEGAPMGDCVFMQIEGDLEKLPDFCHIVDHKFVN